MSQWNKTVYGTIPEDWPICTVKELIESGVLYQPLDGNHGGIHPKLNDFVEQGIPFITAADIQNGNIDLIGCKKIAKEQADSLHKGFSINGDVLLTHKATIGRTAIVPDLETEFIVLTPQVTYYRIKDTAKLNNLYLKYFFDNRYFQDLFLAWANSGSTRDYLGITEQQKLPIVIPPLPEQRAIAAVLSSLDDKIDLLNRQNKTLEGLAATLWRKMFVEDADPNRKITILSDHVGASRGLSYKGNGLAEFNMGIPMHNLNSVYEGGGYKYEGIKYYTGNYQDKHVIKPGDIIVTNTEQGHEFRLIGFPAVVPHCFGETGIFSQHIYKLNILKKSYLTSQFIYYLIMTPKVREQIIGATNGSTVNMLAIDGLQRPEFSLPPEEKVKQFSETVKLFWQKQAENKTEIGTLAALRDSLLPKLMSGEVRVKL